MGEEVGPWGADAGDVSALFALGVQWPRIAAMDTAGEPSFVRGRWAGTEDEVAKAKLRWDKRQQSVARGRIVNDRHPGGYTKSTAVGYCPDRSVGVKLKRTGVADGFRVNCFVNFEFTSDYEA